MIYEIILIKLDICVHKVILLNLDLKIESRFFRKSQYLTVFGIYTLQISKINLSLVSRADFVAR